MAPIVEIALQTKATKAHVDAAATRILAALAERTATGGADNAPRRSGFLASTVGHIPPRGQPVAARSEQRAGSPKVSAQVPAPGANHALVYAAASYALAVELRSPFLIAAAIAALGQIDAIVAREGL